MRKDWQITTVSEIAAPERNALVGGPFGSELGSKDYVCAGIPVIRGQNLDGRWVAGEFVYVTEEKAQRLAANLAKPGDLVFTQRGTLGQISLVPDGPFQRYLVSQSQMKLRADGSKAIPLFLYYVFCSEEQQHYIRSNAIQTGVPHTNLGILRGTPLRLPPLAEQRAIAEILGALDDKIEVNRRINATLEAMARALYQAWFVDFEPVRAKAAGAKSFPMMAQSVFEATPSELVESSRGPGPKGWRVSSIGEEVRVVGGGTPSTTQTEFWENGVHAWATPKDLSKLESPILIETERRVTDAGLERISSGLLPTRTVLLSSRAPIGYLALAEVPTAINQGFIAMVCDKSLPPEYVLNWCAANMEEIKGRANGTTFMEVSKANFRPIALAVPDATSLQAFVDIVRPMYDLIAANLRENRTLAETRDTLLPKLMSGEVRVQS